MKITNNLYNPVPSGPSFTGESSFASWKRVISTMVRSGELYLAENEHIVAVEVSERGLTFVVEKKEN